MKLTEDKHILIVGMGLLGGSYAQSLTAQGFSVRCITRRQSSVDYAVGKGWIESGATAADPELIAWADVAILALYPHIFLEWIAENGKHFRKGTVLTDVTGVKSSVVYRVQELLPDGVEFIAAHPMAGKEVYGVENSDPGIFRGANYIVTPTEKNTAEAIELCRNLGERLGFAHISELTPEKHDRMIAYVSQLTHCIAVSLMTCNRDPHLQDYTGDSFRDLTRIARINEEMWSELFALNKEALISQIDAFAGELHRIRTYLSDGNEEKLKEMMRLSTARRALFDKKTESNTESTGTPS